MEASGDERVEESVPIETREGERFYDRVRKGLRLVSFALVTLFGACVIMLASALMGTATVAAGTHSDGVRSGISFVVPKDGTHVALGRGDVRSPRNAGNG
jgi:hypothetical protein